MHVTHEWNRNMRDPQRPAMAAALRKKSSSQESSDEGAELIQLFRPHVDNLDDIVELLSRASFTAQDIDHFLDTGKIPPNKSPETVKEHEELMESFEQRRKQIREWASMIESGGAEWDTDTERLILTDNQNGGGDNDNNNNNNDDRPLPRPQAAMPPRQELGPANNAPPRLGIAPLPVVMANGGMENEEEEERQWLEREETEAEEAVTRSIQRYEREGVGDDELEVIDMTRGERNVVNLTFRRICFAVLAVVTAFVCIMLQTLPLLSHHSQDPHKSAQRLLEELVHIRNLTQHHTECPSYHRDEPKNLRWFTRLPFWKKTVNCANGVLHIPTSESVNVTWFFPCDASLSDERKLWRDESADSENEKVCRNPTNNLCFRGVHDGILPRKNVTNYLEMGAALISNGSDHNDIHYDTSFLQKQNPDLLGELKHLLSRSYGVLDSVQPVAYRVSVALPLDGAGVPLYQFEGPRNELIRSFNRSVYVDWLETNKRQNEMAAYSLPPPFATEPFRDPCILMSDMDVDSRFQILTSIHLSEAGKDFAGGTSLYVDNHRSNSNPRKKIRRGVTIDGSVGRIVVSTGGQENNRCRLPTRFGVRAVLQIWWDVE